VKYLAGEEVFIQVKVFIKRAMNSLATAVGCSVEAVVDLWYNSTLVLVCHATVS